MDDYGWGRVRQVRANAAEVYDELFVPAEALPLEDETFDAALSQSWRTGSRTLGSTLLTWRPRHPSIRLWMHTDVRPWTLGDKIDDEQFESLVSEAERESHHCVSADGTVEFARPALIASASKELGASSPVFLWAADDREGDLK